MKMKTGAEVKVVPNDPQEREAAVVIGELRENLKRKDEAIQFLQRRVTSLEEMLSKKIAGEIDFSGRMG